jgi:prevent-host-death family protein
MKTVNIHAAKTHLSRLVDEAAAGEEIVIAKAGRPVVRLVAVDDAAAAAERRRRSFGRDKGKIWMSDDFDELPDDVARAFGLDPEDERRKRKAFEPRALEKRRVPRKTR